MRFTHRFFPKLIFFPSTFPHDFLPNIFVWSLAPPQNFGNFRLSGKRQTANLRPGFMTGCQKTGDRFKQASKQTPHSLPGQACPSNPYASSWWSFSWYRVEAHPKSGDEVFKVVAENKHSYRLQPEVPGTTFPSQNNAYFLK